LAPLFFGSVDLLWVIIWTALLSVAMLCGPAEPIGARQRAILSAFIAISSAYALIAVVQVIPHLVGRLDDPIWQRTNDLLQLGVSPRISSRAEIPPVAIGHFLLSVTSLVSGFFVGTSRRGGEVVAAFARHAILLYAIYGLLALALTPGLLLWAPKLAYRGSLTASFVNHNTAATFMGAGAILWFCSAFLTAEALRVSSLRLLVLLPTNEEAAFKLILRLAAGLTCFFALLLTGSRGGLICSCLGLLVGLGLMIANRLKPGVWYVLASASAALAAMLVWLSHMGRIGSEGLFDNGRWRVYGFCLEAIRQHPLLGTGAGTFPEIFPSLRTADFEPYGVWEHAHSTILEIAVEMGVPIAAIIAAAAVASVFILARAALKSKDRNRRVFAATAGILVLSYTHSTIDFSLQIPGYLIVFGIILGCGLARSAADETPPPQKAGSRLSVVAGSPVRTRKPVFETVSETVSETASESSSISGSNAK